MGETQHFVVGLYEVGRDQEKDNGCKWQSTLLVYASRSWVGLVPAHEVTANPVSFTVFGSPWRHSGSRCFNEPIRRILRAQIQNYVQYLQCQRASLWCKCKSKPVQSCFWGRLCTEYLQKTKTRTSESVTCQSQFASVYTFRCVTHFGIFVYGCVCIRLIKQ